MTDDEVSELAECLWDACAEAEKHGKRVGPRLACAPPLPVCPLEALTGEYNLPTAASLAGLSRRQVDEFGAGFDSGHDGNPLKDLGCRFREQALSGEGFR